MVLGKQVAIFDWGWGRNSAPREGQKMPWITCNYQVFEVYQLSHFLTEFTDLVILNMKTLQVLHFPNTTWQLCEPVSTEIQWNLS